MPSSIRPGPKYPQSRVVISRLLERLCLPFVKWQATPPIRPEAVRRILLVEPFDLGDAASLSVTLEPLKARFPTAEIHLLLKPPCHEIYEGCKLVTAIHTVELPWARRHKELTLHPRSWLATLRILRFLRRLRFDIAIDARGEIRSQLLMLLIGCPVRVGYTNYLCSNIRIRGVLLTHNAGDLSPQPRALLNLALIRLLGCEAPQPRFPVPIEVPPLPGPPRDNRFRIVVHPGGVWAFKQWKPANWAALLQRLNHPEFDVHIITAPFERELRDRLEAACPGMHTWHTTSLREMLAQIGHCDLFVGNDSGPMHLAEYLGKPIVALFGPANLAVWRPCGEHHSVLHHQEQYSCAPCLQRTCIRPEFSCLDAIAIHTVQMAVIRHYQSWRQGIALPPAPEEEAGHQTLSAEPVLAPPGSKVLLTGGSGFIGTNLVTRLLHQQCQVLDLSATPPMDSALRHTWQECDILDAEAVRAAFRSFQPDIVIHLAARTDCDEATTVEQGYRTNTDGTANVLAAIRETASVQRAIITSSQFVCGPARLPVSDTDYFPHTVYGQSKVITEQLTRAANLPCCWTLIRPTNIWGPWHQRYSREFWRIAAHGLYFHPGGAPVIRCYGYVGTIIDQMLQILNLPSDLVNRKTLYVGDPADDIYLWANAFCMALRGRRAPRVPRLVLRIAGLAGDAISRATGKEFYITTSRYRSMTSNYPTRMDATYELLGLPRFTVEQGVRETVQWLRTRGPEEFHAHAPATGFQAESD